MSERRTVYSDPEAFVPDRLRPEGYGQVVGLVTGELFTRNVYIENLAHDNTLEFHTDRQVVVAVMRDADGNMYCEPYNPELHGEEAELRKMSMHDFEITPTFLMLSQRLPR